jgi:hypothetical protein
MFNKTMYVATRLATMTVVTRQNMVGERIHRICAYTARNGRMDIRTAMVQKRNPLSI